MKRIYVSTYGSSDWRILIENQQMGWARKASETLLSGSWERAQTLARGIPPEIAKALDKQSELYGAHLLAAFPEHKVNLKGRGKPIQSNVWSLLLTESGYLSMAVDGNTGEPFGSTIGDWKNDATNERQERLDVICEILQITSNPSPGLRIQLFLRTVCAVLEAQRYRAPFALMLVQSFREKNPSWKDYAAFCELLGAIAVRGGISEARRTGSQRLFLGWVDRPIASGTEITREWSSKSVHATRLSTQS